LESFTAESSWLNAALNALLCSSYLIFTAKKLLILIIQL
jgi:hypothetical protein